MIEMLLVRFGELNLKGKNRQFFVRRLVKNIKDALTVEKVDLQKIRQQRHRLSLHFSKQVELGRAVPVLQRVFGISSLSPVETIGIGMAEIEQAVKRYAGELSHPKQTSFRITVQRLNKKFSMTSIELERHLGTLVQKETGWKVNLTAPDVTIRLEIDTAVALFTEKLAGAGGLPVGVEGKVLCLIGETKERDLVAAHSCLKRGCEIALVSIGEVKHLAALKETLQRFAYGSALDTYTVRDTSKLEALMEKLGARGVATGAPAAAYLELPEEIFILAPLVGLSDKKITEEAQRLSS